MADQNQTPTLPQDGKPIAEAIALFEGILQTTPDDRVALEALSLAYAQAGDTPHARATLIRLAHVLVRKDEREPARAVASQLEAFAADDFEALEALRSIQTMLASTPEAAAAAAPKNTAATRLSDVALRRQVLNREMGMAWELMQANELNQEQYATIVEDLSRLSADERHSTVSLLHVLSDRAWPDIDRILRYLSKRSGAPIVPLTSFDVQKDTSSAVPLDYWMRLGALPFEKLGEEYLVAVLNPLDDGLRRDVETILGHACHRYLALPADFDTVCQKLQQSLAAEAGA
ncbi:MAG: hypothetical protein PHR35_02930 [Kiritimatiellae bacterium]|nr:hypothetical protein [Kiritimatiellia bacterium]